MAGLHSNHALQRTWAFETPGQTGTNSPSKFRFDPVSSFPINPLPYCIHTGFVFFGGS